MVIRNGTYPYPNASDDQSEFVHQNFMKLLDFILMILLRALYSLATCICVLILALCMHNIVEMEQREDAHHSQTL